MISLVIWFAILDLMLCAGLGGYMLGVWRGAAQGRAAAYELAVTTRAAQEDGWPSTVTDAKYEAECYVTDGQDWSWHADSAWPPVRDFTAERAGGRIVVAENVVNLTPHDIVIYETDGYDEPMLGAPAWVLPPTGPEPRLVEVTTPTQHTLVAGKYSARPGDRLDTYVRTVAVDYGQVQDLPERKPGTVYVVSLLVALARPDRHDLRIPYPLVRDGQGRIIGCLGFGQVGR